MVEKIERLFPKLLSGGFRVTSDSSDKYNCFAWAGGNDHQWWEPSGEHDWPEGVLRDYSLRAYTQLYSLLGFVPCNSVQLEDGYEKVAIFVLDADEPSHAARQLLDGRWTSKIGDMEDIEHALRDLEGDLYGTVALILSRPRPPSA